MAQVFLTLFLMFAIPLMGVTINVRNDSPYTLHAKVYTNSGHEMTDMVVSSGHSIKYQDSPFNARDYAKGPFKVIFTCPNGEEYGRVSNVSQNFTVYARSARGAKKCKAASQPHPHRDEPNSLPHHTP